MKNLLLLLVLPLLLSCEKNDEQVGKSIEIEVLYNGKCCSDAFVICVYSQRPEVLIRCDGEGVAEIPTNGLISLIAIAPFKSAIVSTVLNLPSSITLEDVPKSTKSETYQGTFGVYDTDGKGDVRFRYQGAFQYYYCINYLPSIPPNTPDPNNWDGWDLTDFLPWLGKKLLVPRTYQWYNAGVYGYSISDALMLVSEI